MNWKEEYSDLNTWLSTVTIQISSPTDEIPQILDEIPQILVPKRNLTHIKIYFHISTNLLCSLFFLKWLLLFYFLSSKLCSVLQNPAEVTFSLYFPGTLSFCQNFSLPKVYRYIASSFVSPKHLSILMGLSFKGNFIIFIFPVIGSGCVSEYVFSQLVLN